MVKNISFWSVLLFTFTFKFVNSATNPKEQRVGNESQQVEIEKYEIFTKIRYRYARTMVFCQMRNTHQTEGQEAVFELDLSLDAFISNFTMEINGQQSKSLIKEKSQANNEYLKAKRSGTNSAIINQNEDRNVFEITINLAANTSVLFFLEYEEEIRRLQTGLYEYSLSMIPQIKQVKHLCIDVEVVESNPFLITSINVCNKMNKCLMDMDRNNDSIIFPSENKTFARIIWEPTINDGVTKLLQIGTLGYFSIQYKLLGNQSNNDVVIRNGYFVHRFNTYDLNQIPLHVIFVLDTSASMDGVRGENMKKAMRKILLDLEEHDVFNIIKFATNAEMWQPNSTGHQLAKFYRAVDRYKSLASEYIKNLEFHGSTNILEALQEALKLAEISSSDFRNLCQTLNEWGQSTKICEGPEPTPMIFFLTDGYPTTGVTDLSEILDQIRLANAFKFPIFTIGLGSSAQFPLLQTISAQYKGLSRKIYDDADVELQLTDFFNFAASAVFKDLNFKYTTKIPGMKISEVSYVSENEPWLSSSGEIAVSGKIIIDDNLISLWPHFQHDHGVRSVDYLNVEITNNKLQFKACLCPCGKCQRASNALSCNTNLNLNLKLDGTFCPKNDQEDSFMERLWVHKTLQKLIREEVRSGNATVLQKILTLSKQYNLVTPYTSLIIIPPDTSKEPIIIHTPSSVPNLTQPLSWTKGIPKAILRASEILSFPKSLMGMAYSGSSEIQNVPTLSNYLQYLLLAQANFLMETENSQVEESLPLEMDKVPPGLQDIQWIDQNQNLTLRLRNNNETHRFEISRQKSEEPILYSKCSVKLPGISKLRGKCTHLINCLENDFLDDSHLFFDQYFCPIIDKNVKYVGTCCTKFNNLKIKA